MTITSYYDYDYDCAYDYDYDHDYDYVIFSAEKEFFWACPTCVYTGGFLRSDKKFGY